MCAPILGFVDLESLIVPVEGCKNNPKKQKTRAIEIHKPCSCALLFVALEEQKHFFFDLQCGPGFMDQFVKTLDQVGKKIYNEKKNIETLSGCPVYPKKRQKHVGFVQQNWIKVLTIQPCYINATKQETFWAGHTHSATSSAEP